MSFGNKLKELRKEKGWSQDKLGEIVNMHSKHISKYELGLVKPTSDAIIKIAKAFNVSTDYLLLEENTDELTSSEIKDNKLLDIFKELSRMDDKDKEAIISVLDAFIAKNKK